MQLNTFNFKALAICSFAVAMAMMVTSIDSLAAPGIPSLLITVDPGVNVDVSGGDDLKAIRRYFGEASWESPISPRTWDQLRLLGISSARLINVETRKTALVNPDKKGIELNPSRRLLAGLADCRKYGLIPHIVVGQVPQIALANRREGKYYGISDLAMYEKYAYSFLKYIMVDHGFTEADFEVANEPDINGASWLLLDKCPMGSLSMYQAYMRLYGAWANAADKLAREYPQLKLEIGGPDTTPFTYTFGRFNWDDHFIKDVAAKGLRLDFVSIHVYGNNASLDGLPAFGRYPSFSDRIDQLSANLRTAGLVNIPIFVTEWGASSEINESPKGIINGNNVGAAWMARFLMNMVVDKVGKASFLVFRDHTNPKRSSDNWGWPSFLLADGVTQKATYNVARMFSMLPGHRVKISSLPSNGSIGVVASADKSEVGVLVFNQDWDFPHAEERAKNVQVLINLKELPFHTSSVHVVRYLMDKTHSNAYYFHKHGLPITPANSGLQRVDDEVLPVKNGIVNLPNTTMAPSSVTLWEISANGNTQ